MVESIRELEPLIVFEDDSWGELLTSELCIEFNMGESEDLYSFAIHIRGSELAMPVIGNILEKLNLKTAYGDNDAFFDINKAKGNMQAWMCFRDRILVSEDG